MPLVVVVRRRRRRTLEPHHRPPQVFGARRIGGETVLKIAADDLGDVFDPTEFKSEWTPGEVERVVQALPGFPLPFDPANVAASIETLDKLAFEVRTKDSTSALSCSGRRRRRSGQWRLCALG